MQDQNCHQSKKLFPTLVCVWKTMLKFAQLFRTILSSDIKQKTIAAAMVRKHLDKFKF
jgi:hypothetical protein